MKDKPWVSADFLPHLRAWGMTWQTLTWLTQVLHPNGTRRLVGWTQHGWAQKKNPDIKLYPLKGSGGMTVRQEARYHKSSKKIRLSWLKPVTLAFHLRHCNYMVFWPPSHFMCCVLQMTSFLAPFTTRGCWTFSDLTECFVDLKSIFHSLPSSYTFYQNVTRSIEHNLYVLH